MTTIPPLCLSVYSENQVGVLSRLTAAFTRRNINIESLVVSSSDLDGVHRFTVQVCIPFAKAQRIALHLERQIDILAAEVHVPERTWIRELGLYRLPASVTDDPAFSAAIAPTGARLVHQDQMGVLLELTDTPAAHFVLQQALRPWPLLDMARTGALALDLQANRVRAAVREMLVPSNPAQFDDSGGAAVG